MPNSKRKPREAVKSFFKGFDSVVDHSQFDGDEISQVSDSQGGHTQINGVRAFSSKVLQTTVTNGTQHQAGSNIFRDNDSPISRPATQAPPSSKRPAPQEEEDDSAAEEQMRDKLLPAQRAMKRRRLEEEREARRKGLPIPTLEEPSPAPETEAQKRKKPPPKKPVNLKDAIRDTRAAEESRRRRPEDEPQNDLDDRDVEEMRNLAIVEEMPIVPRTNVPARSQGPAHTSDRWDERWNGRQNFKKFRRRGPGAPAHRGGSGIMIQLEEVQRRNFGIGEAYWQGAEARKEKKKVRERDREVEESQDVGRGRAKRVKGEVEEEGGLETVPKELADGMEEVVDVDAPRRTRARDREEDDEEEEPVRNRRGRPKGAVGAVKRKMMAVREEEDSDSDEDLKFRFKKKRR